MRNLSLLALICLVSWLWISGCGSNSGDTAQDTAVSTDTSASTEGSGSTAADANVSTNAQEPASTSSGDEQKEDGTEREEEHEKAETKPGSGPAGKGAKLDAALVSTGKQKFETAGCLNCHSVGGNGGKTAPDLSKVGAEHGDAEFYMKLLLDPSSMGKPSMPSFAHLPESDRRAIAEYLRSLR